MGDPARMAQEMRVATAIAWYEQSPQEIAAMIMDIERVEFLLEIEIKVIAICAGIRS